jgi:hypothetical protein
MLVAACVVFLRDFYVKSVLGIGRKKFLERGVNFNCSRICSKSFIDDYFLNIYQYLVLTLTKNLDNKFKVLMLSCNS